MLCLIEQKIGPYFRYWCHSQNAWSDKIDHKCTIFPTWKFTEEYVKTRKMRNVRIITKASLDRKHEEIMKPRYPRRRMLPLRFEPFEYIK